MKEDVKVSQMDKEHLRLIRKNVSDFIEKCALKYDKQGTYLLDIAPQDYEGAIAFFKETNVYTLDINPEAEADYTVDICQNSEELIDDNYFDYILCTEVLEHTLNPFSAIKEINRILKPGGLVFITVPFNFRIHGPLPDCWRFTEYGLKELLKKFTIKSLEKIETADRDLMPIHYRVIAKKEEC
ncbi:methyltransferase family protein [Halobacteroides halobius DSM 5150]|uniref:Methyltransferase family protein n=1 Tax=Halobacteroides halobius (strain ATCC 35273 / DSM 5150 / MD-1) TaxID=748449 RepID=L0KAT9_HALHC|nr:class I SAM-dependent methyltransferase [Halobacteroides halobius]AGB42131.1 methyltransferase family protein [Halobacteroides halobius DSM 5150]